ncbi:MAG: hypothetical protein JWM74_2000 [Myxococcaceae bacterium]|nr:hypothetical protein [Myxococcaceae bacterium]
MKSARVALCVVALTLAACGGSPPSETKTQSNAATDTASADKGCDFLIERLTTVATRLTAVQKDSKENAAKYNTIGDVMGKLATDLDVKWARADVGALASDYRAAAKSTSDASHEVAGMLDKLEEAADHMRKTTSKRYVESVQQIAATCKGSTAADCKTIIDTVRSLGGSEGKTTAATVEAGRASLADIKVTTKGLKPQLAEVVASLAEMRDMLKTVDEVDGQARAKISSYERAAGQLAGLNQRGDAMCRNK